MATWDSTTRPTTIAENLKALKDQLLRETDRYPRREVVGTARHIIGMYREGYLSPGDTSVDVTVYDAENAHLVQEYLDSLTPAVVVMNTEDE